MEDYTPRPRRTAVAEVIPEQRPVVAYPKFDYVLDKRLRDMCRAMECMLCGVHGRSTWAHSNQAIRGKGRNIKASDVYVAALCPECHHEIDEGHRWSQEVKVAAWNAEVDRKKADKLARRMKRRTTKYCARNWQRRVTGSGDRLSFWRGDGIRLVFTVSRFPFALTFSVQFLLWGASLGFGKGYDQ